MPTSLTLRSYPSSPFWLTRAPSKAVLALCRNTRRARCVFVSNRRDRKCLCAEEREKILQRGASGPGGVVIGGILSCFLQQACIHRRTTKFRSYSCAAPPLLDVYPRPEPLQRVRANRHSLVPVPAIRIVPETEPEGALLAATDDGPETEPVQATGSVLKT